MISKAIYPDGGFALSDGGTVMGKCYDCLGPVNQIYQVANLI